MSLRRRAGDSLLSFGFRSELPPEIAPRLSSMLDQPRLGVVESWRPPRMEISQPFLAICCGAVPHSYWHLLSLPSCLCALCSQRGCLLLLGRVWLHHLCKLCPSSFSCLMLLSSLDPAVWQDEESLGALRCCSDSAGEGNQQFTSNHIKSGTDFVGSAPPRHLCLQTELLAPHDCLGEGQEDEEGSPDGNHCSAQQCMKGISQLCYQGNTTHHNFWYQVFLPAGPLPKLWSPCLLKIPLWLELASCCY